jgi:hypothetical protein
VGLGAVQGGELDGQGADIHADILHGRAFLYGGLLASRCFVRRLRTKNIQHRQPVETRTYLITQYMRHELAAHFDGQITK